MNTKQLVAIMNHCRLAGETANPMFGTRYREGSVILTVNSGYE